MTTNKQKQTAGTLLPDVITVCALLPCSLLQLDFQFCKQEPNPVFIGMPSAFLSACFFKRDCN